MRLEEFKRRVRTTFGKDLHRASPATVRDFLDAIQDETPLTLRDDARIVIDEEARSYEEIVRTFFTRVLDLPPEQAMLTLWAFAFDLSYSVIESQDSDRIGHLFRNFDSFDSDSGSEG